MTKGYIVIGNVKTLAVICATKAEYIAHIEKDLIPILEQYHNVKFLRDHADQSFRAKGFYIFRLKEADQLRGLGNYQLVKCGGYYNHPELEEIERLYAMEVSRRSGPVHGA